jgi:hypothetical protein
VNQTVHRSHSCPYKTLRLACKFLQERRKEAWDLRLQYLATIEELAVLLKDKTREKAIHNIRLKNEQERTFRLLKIYTQNDQKSAIIEIKIPVDPMVNPRDPIVTEWKAITDQATMETTLITWLRKHFAQAQGSPFTVKPLISLCGTDGLAPFCGQVLDDMAGISQFPAPAQDILRAMKRTAPLLPYEEPISKNIFSKFRKWTKRTTTSPSTCHLGHYKALFADISSSVTPLSKTLSPLQDELLHLVCDVHMLTCCHCRPLTRWLKTWNLLLLKIARDYRIHKIKTLHIGEADKSLEQKRNIARTIMHHA